MGLELLRGSLQEPVGWRKGAMCQQMRTRASWGALCRVHWAECNHLQYKGMTGHPRASQVYTMVAHVITEQTSMMYGRHLDQVILCALYGVCKVNQLRQITFKDIITHYKKQAQAKNSIFRTVAIRMRHDLSVRRPLPSLSCAMPLAGHLGRP